MQTTLMYTTALIAAIYLTTGIFGESCDTKSAPAMVEIATCCRVEGSTNETPKQKEMREQAKSCLQTRRTEYEPLSDDEVKQLGGKFNEYRCMSECIYKRIGLVGEDGVVDKEKFIEVSKESLPDGPTRETALKAMTKCIDELDLANLCSPTRGMHHVAKCFIAEMTLNCPEKQFNNTEVCQNGREYLKSCEETFIQSEQ